VSIDEALVASSQARQEIPVEAVDARWLADTHRIPRSVLTLRAGSGQPSFSLEVVVVALRAAVKGKDHLFTVLEERSLRVVAPQLLIISMAVQQALTALCQQLIRAG